MTVPAQSNVSAASLWRRVSLVLIAVAAIVVLAWLLSQAIGGDDDTQSTASTETTGGDATATTVVTQHDPAFRIQPQRARAGSPLVLDARGEGCVGGSGVLSVIDVGSVDSVSPTGRLVLRRRFDVAGDGTWSTAPLLVNQPEGKYRVTAACERRPTVDGFVPAADRRDLFEASELLELTGPANLRAFDISPRAPTPGAATQVRLSGAGDCRSGRVVGSVFPLRDQPVAPKPFTAAADAAGNWAASIAFAAAEATGSYSVEATCVEQFSFATEHIRFVDGGRFQLASLVGKGTKATPARPVRGRPTFTG